MQIPNKFLFSSNMDGTLLPNGTRSAAPGCLERTKQLLTSLKAADCPIVYVTDRHLPLAQEGQRTFRLPSPDYWICNVGTEISDGQGNPDSGWQKKLGPAFDRKALLDDFNVVPRLKPQEEEAQGPHKLGLYYPLNILDDTMRAWLVDHAREIVGEVHIVERVDDSTAQAMLDLVPTAAGKAAALRHLADKLGFTWDQVFLSGDSGNDISLLISGLCGTMMGNALPIIREQASTAAEKNTGSRLFLSESCYGDGIIDGLLMYRFAEPQVKMNLTHGLNFQNLRGDIYGGLTAAVVALPLALAFGVSSGAGPVAGLYGAIFVGFFAAIFGGTPSQISGPTGPMTVVMAAVFTQYTALYPNDLWDLL